MSDDAVYADDGSYLGEMVMVDDQTAVLVNDGQIISASAIDPSSPDGWAQLDPAEFTIEGEDDGADPRLAEVAARQEELEQRIANPPPVPQYVPQPDPDEIWAPAVNREIENLQQQLGRDLTQPEMFRLLADHKADFDAGVEPNVYKSAAQAGLHEPFTHDGRVGLMVDLIEDANRPEGEQPDSRPPRVEPASSDPADVRRAAITNTAHGHDTDDWGSDPGEEEIY